jgi:hypothetical protein
VTFLKHWKWLFEQEGRVRSESSSASAVEANGLSAQCKHGRSSRSFDVMLEQPLKPALRKEEPSRSVKSVSWGRRSDTWGLTPIRRQY